jgi:hypothetical protein
VRRRPAVAAVAAGLHAMRNMSGWSNGIAGFDNDGWKDRGEVDSSLCSEHRQRVVSGQVLTADCVPL